MKKAIRILFIALVIALLCVPGVASALDITRGVITGSSVALRKSADSKSALIGRLGKNAAVEILDTNVNAEWHKVKYRGKTGYVNRMYINWDSSLPAYKQSYTGKVVNVKEFVNVRGEPKTGAKALGEAEKGEKLDITRKDYASGWHQVSYNGKKGYIASRYLDVSVKVGDSQLSGLSVKGGSLAPSFSPDEYGYVVAAASPKVTISAKANSGVKVDIGGTGKSSVTYSLSSGSMKTVRITLDGNVRYSVYIMRNVLTVGTWNIKRGYGNLLMQGRLVRDQQPDIMGIQEVYRNLKAKELTDNLASLKTAKMSNTAFSKALDQSGNGEYGTGILSRYKPVSVSTYKLESTGEQRVLAKAVYKINGKKLSFYNAHLTPGQSARAKQLQQIVSIMKADKNKYKILTGDFNIRIAEFAEFDIFKDYKVIINKDTKYYDYQGNLIDNGYLDNVIVTKNIKVVNSRIIKVSLSDHFPVFTYLVLK